MDKKLIQAIENELHKKLNSERLNHTHGVAKAATLLAERYGENPHDAKIAALLHDYAKDFTKTELLEYIRKHKLKVDKLCLMVHELLHGVVAASIAQRKFQIQNIDILNAISNHTTGRRGMSKLEKIIYLADFIEEGRIYPGVEGLREAATKSLDKAVYQALNNTIIFVVNTGKFLHPNTLYARNELLLGMDMQKTSGQSL